MLTLFRMGMELQARSGLESDAAAVFAGDAEMARLGREFDWSRTSLGPVEEWPEALRVAVRMALESPFPINLWSGPDLLLIYNDAYRALLGAKHPRAFGRSGREVWSEIWSEIEPLFTNIERGGPPAFAEDARFLLERASGPPTEGWFTFSLSPIRSDDGAIIAFLNIAAETTQRVLAEREIDAARKAAEEQVALYRFLANAIPVQVWTATPEGALDYVSERTAQYFGKSPAEVVGDQWLSVLHPDDVRRTLDRWSRSLATGEPYQVEFRLCHAKSHEYRWHLARATAQRDESGAIVRWVGTNTDIEDNKRAEAELERLTVEANEANSAKSAFLASMSHELRTPLNAIGGYAQLLEMGVRGPINEKQRADLLKIQRSKNHLDSLVSDVLNFAKLNAGRVEYHVSVAPIKPIVGTVVDMITPQLTAKTLQLDVAPIAGELTVRADEDKVRQILVNLLGNAIKFTPEGGTISVEVSATPTQVIARVTDTGIGIAADLIDKIFDPFVQAKSTLVGSVQGAGVGLGLAISRQLARGMGGDVTATSVAAEGSAFTLSLPRG